MTSCRGINIDHSKRDVPHYKQISADDHEKYDISVHFEDAAEWIHDKLMKTSVMVHCLAGVSRSVSLVIAYFIKHKGMSYQDAYGLIKARRRIIHPNDGFIEKLKKYEREHRSRERSPQLKHHPQSASPDRYAHVPNRHFQSKDDFSSRMRAPSPQMRYPRAEPNAE